MDYKKECRNALDIFEQSFRVFVRDKMLESFGHSWWKTNVPEQIANACRERIDKEESQRFPIFPASEPIYYTSIGELKDLICRKDNFEQAFKPFFGSTETISSKLTELIAFRNPAAHNRPVFGPDHYEAIIVTCRSVFDAMEMVRPPLFQTTGSQFAEPMASDHESVELMEDESIKPPSCIDNLPRPDYSTFFGRDTERNEILDHLNHPRAWITIIDGIGGVGKTALALNCGEHIREAALAGSNDFEHIIWASAKSERLTSYGISQVQPTFSDLSSLIRTILEVTGFDSEEAEDRVALAKGVLAISKTLLILDNLETVFDLGLYNFLQDMPVPSKGRYEEALGQITHLVPETQNIPEAERLSNMLVESAFRAYQGGNYSEAIGRLENAQSYRETAYLNHTWAVIERDEGAFGRAREKFRKSLELDGARLPSWRSWGRMEQRLENWQRAVECFSQATQLPKSDPQDFHGLGVCLSKLARGAARAERGDLLLKGRAALEQGFFRNPLGYRETHHNVVNGHALALALDRLGEREGALIQCRNGLRLEPNNERLIDLRMSLSKK